MERNKLIRSLVLLLIVIIGSAFLIRSFTSGETLLDYADKNNIPVHSEENSPN